MPYVSVKFSSPMPSKEEQDKVAKEITEVLIRNLGKNPDRTVITFEEVKAENFYFGGESTADMRKKNG